MMGVQARGFHHIALVTGDAPRARVFYEDVLGLDVVAESASRDGAELWFGRDGGRPGTLLRVQERRGVGAGHPGAGGVHHFALGVETREAQLMWKRWLMDRGIPVSGPYNRGWFHSIYFADPDGQIVEIATRGPGYDVDEPADALGRKIVIPPGAELRGVRDEAEVDARTHPEPVPELTTVMRLDGIHHISGLTEDVARIGEFYESGLGLRPVKRSVNQDDASMPHWFWASYDGRVVAPHSSLTMFGGWEEGGVRLAGRLRRAGAGTGQASAIAFRAADDDELSEWSDRLRSVGTDVSDVIDEGWYRSVRLVAPDGMVMNIATDLPGLSGAEAA